MLGLWKNSANPESAHGTREMSNDASADGEGRGMLGSRKDGSEDGMNGANGMNITVDASMSVLDGLRRLRMDKQFTDCTLLVPVVPVSEAESAPDVRFDCHRAVLASASPYFADSLSTSGSILHLKEHSADVIETIVAFIYTGHVNLTSRNLLKVYEASTRLSVTSLSDACAEFLVDNARAGSMGLFQRLDVGLRLGEPKVVQTCMEELVAGESLQLEGNDIFFLSEKAMHLFLQMEDLQVEEIALFRALLRWGKTKCPRTIPLGSFLEPYLMLLRYALMNATEIEKEVRIYDFVPREKLLDAALALCKNPSEWDLSQMMLRQRNSIFVYRWRVQWNAVKDEEEVWSEPFSFIFAGIEHRWKILMYPNGKNTPQYISFFLYTDPEDPESKRWRKSADFDFLLTDFTKRKRSQFFAKEPSLFSPETPSWGFTKFRERKLVDNPDSSFLSDGVLEFELALKMHSVDYA
eukprot:Plantae.Rhodophyta-Purpureofilum_apyrenoidigerum.ctg24437.p1 GENE.Plantae.Rhodophyta-Purpureofilum_apyrenoidigerum.ctg24437~~Plantae.Rhodophyta-Purpureofilum_apyrenoidigerum.ctg24437.p1  ORF type:complete len:466 (-),score=110.47 Plantae.Rhodophyta-Purpureofilum_apyrenoidigerum.ctg24437:133-1530(-)